MSELQMIPEMIPISEASRRTGLSYENLRRLCLQKQIVHIRVGAKNNKFLINYDRLIEYLNTSNGSGGDKDDCQNDS